jgi:hypothetical protein
MGKWYLVSMRIGRRKANLPLVACLAVSLFIANFRCLAQGTLRITFNGNLRPDTSVYIPNYYESGVWFEPLPGSGGFIRGNGIGTTIWPDNGTDYLQATAGDTLQFYLVNKSVFDLTSVDLAGYSTVLPDFNVDFVGYKADGSTVVENISGSGIDFKTYYFDSRFSDLTRVEMPVSIWSLDNVVFTIPEPSQSKLLIFGATTLWAARRFKSRRCKGISPEYLHNSVFKQL